MNRIEIHGKFVFDGGAIDFHFDGSDEVLQFGRVTTMEEFRAAMVGLVTTGTQAYLSTAFGKSGGEAESPNSGMPPTSPSNALQEMERRFREHQQHTEQTLEKLAKQYEAATADITASLTGAPGISGTDEAK